VAFAADRIPIFRKTLEGQPVLILSGGQLIEKQILKAGLSDDLVLQAIREHGFEDARQVHMAVLEVDGTISIVPTGGPTMRTRHRVRAVRPGGN
jgi:uncharacterized membrane protein YcaP (DUF421 family)